MNTTPSIAESNRRPGRPFASVICDALLVSIAVLVIARSYLPDPPKRQLIWCRTASGVIERYSLSLDDPRLTGLHQQLRRWREHRPADTLGVTRWESETAQFYSQQLEIERSPVAQVSYALPSSVQPAAAPAVDSGPGSQRYWLAVRDECEQVLRKQAASLSRYIRERGDPPVVFGRVISPAISGQELGFCATLGLLAAVAFAVWAIFFPPIELLRRENCQHPSGADAAADLRFVVPRNWIRVRQPPAVRIRQCTFALLVFWALIRGLG